jgi:hypothetical protein
MRLSVLQRRNLQALLSQRRDGVSVIRSLAKWKMLLAAHAVIALGGGFYLTQSRGWQLVGAGLMGMAFGSFIRVVRTMMTVQRVWPVTAEIIDWQKVESLLAEDLRKN